jgi:putative transposase
VFDACANGQQLKCLTLVDEYTRGMPGHRRGRIDPVAPRHRRPESTDQRAWRTALHPAPTNGPEFVSTALMKWALEQQIETAIHRPRQALAERHQRKLQRQVSG